MIIGTHKYQLGDKVCSKKTGYPTNGTVVGVFFGNVYSKLNGGKPAFLWNKLYPDWEEKFVYLIEFNDYQKSLTFEEFKFQLMKENKIISDEEITKLYNNIPLSKAAFYPEDDLENEYDCETI